jgi:hypothetical protein
VIAELFTSGYTIVGRESPAETFDQLLTELRLTSQEAENLGVVSVVRSGGQGVALVQTRKRGYVRVEVDATQGTVAESWLALRVLELLRDVDLPEPVRDAPRPVVRPPIAPRDHGPELWLGAGTTFAGDLSSPSLWLGLSAAFNVSGPLSLEPTIGASLIPARAEGEAGEVELHAQQVAVYAMLEPFSGQDVGLAFGLGGGLTFLQESATPSPGYRGFDDSTRVGIAGARFRFFLRSGHVGFMLAVDPGLLLPRPSLELDGAATHELGWPWITATLGVGVSL